MTYRQHISQALSNAVVNGPDIMIELSKAQDEANPARRIERLCEAQLLANEIKIAVDAAVETERKLKVVA